MSRVLFITEDKLKENSVIQKNVDSKLLGSIMYTVQDINIQPVLGSGIYNELKNQITNSSIVTKVNAGELYWSAYTEEQIIYITGNTVTELNRTLLNEYIIPALIKYVEAESCINLNFKITNANVNTPTPEHAQAVGIDDAFRLRTHFKDIAEWYATRLTEYLCENSTSYPLYHSPGTGSDIIHPTKDNYNCGLYLGD